MDLRSGELFWPATSPGPHSDGPLGADAACDVLVVGSGISGALAAYELARIGARVIVADRRPACSGSTPASTALVQYELDTPLTELTGLLGAEHAQAAYLAASAALGRLTHVADDLATDCELTRRESLYLASKPNDEETLGRECQARRDIGLPVAYLTRDALRTRFGIDRPGAIISSTALEVNPVRLTVALLSAAAARGVRIHDRTDIDLDAVKTQTPPFRLKASGGHAITADWVVIATGYETPPQFEAIARLTELSSTYALAAGPVTGEPWPESVLVWEAAEPYFYARATGHGRILIGGEDEPFVDPAARDALIPDKTRALMSKLGTLFPHLRLQSQRSWAGTFAQTADGLPYIGRHRGWPNVLFALGYGGNGITFSVVAAQVIADTIGGRPNHTAALFGFDRSPSARSTPVHTG